MNTVTHNTQKNKFLMTNLCRFIPLFFCMVSVGCVSATPSPDPVESSSIAAPAPEETVTIDGTTYPVPEAWIGQKLDAPPLKTPALVRIPHELTQDQTDIYILREAWDALVLMAEGARKDGVSLRVDSGYRSAWYQRKIFSNLMKKGRSFEDLVRYVAPPGYSEHMLGTVVDFSPGNWRFAKTPAYAWLREHAGEYGFSETYPKNNRRHPWESWHWRYRKTGVAGSKHTN